MAAQALLDTLRQCTAELEAQIAAQHAECTELARKVERLDAQLKAALEDNEDMRRVSRIIAVEKENASLKLQLTSLQRRLAQQVPVAQAPAPEPEPEPEDAAEEEEEEAFEVIEKKIQKKIYYVSNDAEARIYEKEADGSVGRCVGHLVPPSPGDGASAKPKVKWLGT